MKTKTILITLIIVTLALTACTESPTGKIVHEQELEEISVRLPIPIINSAFTPFYSAIDQGYYEEEGLNVKYNLGTSQQNPVRMIAAGTDDFGVVGGPDTMIVGKSNGQPLKAVAIMHKNSDFPVLITLKESGIETVKDLEGKKIGFFYGHISTDIIHSLLNNHDISYEEIDVGFGATQLVSNSIDAQWAWRVNMPHDLQKQGYENVVISPKEYGINTHGYTIFVDEEMIKERPELIEKYLRATFKGMKFSKENPEEAIKSILTRNPDLDIAWELEQLAEYNRVSTGSNEAYGYMDYEMFKETYDRLNEENVLGSEFDVKDAFTTEFLEKIKGTI